MVSGELLAAWMLLPFVSGTTGTAARRPMREMVPEGGFRGQIGERLLITDRCTATEKGGPEEQPAAGEGEDQRGRWCVGALAHVGLVVAAPRR